VRRLLRLNRDVPAPLVEVVLISRNDPDTGVRVRNALEHYCLPIVRCAFTGGADAWPYAEAFGSSLFLSAHRADVAAGLAQGVACGEVLPGALADDEADDGLRVAFDFDGVLASDEGERMYRDHGLEHYRAEERARLDQPLAPGPLQALLSGLSRIQVVQPRLRTAIITARSAPADRRVVTTLRAWGLRVDEAFFVGDMAKDRILRLFRPHLFFDDKRQNAELAAGTAPAVHIPFGVLNPR
jgi:5'-nucleotidase